MKTTSKCFLAYKSKSSHFSSCLKVTHQVKSKHSSIPIQPTDGSMGASTQSAAATMKSLACRGKAAQRHRVPSAVACAGPAPLSHVQGEQRHCRHGQVWTHLSGLEELHHQCCRPSIHPAAPLVLRRDHSLEAGAQPWFSITQRDCQFCAQDHFMTHIKAHWVTWEMRLKTSHQTEELTRMCAEKGLEWSKSDTHNALTELPTICHRLVFCFLAFCMFQSKNVNPRHIAHGQFWSLCVVPFESFLLVSSGQSKHGLEQKDYSHS